MTMVWMTQRRLGSENIWHGRKHGFLKQVHQHRNCLKLANTGESRSRKTQEEMSELHLLREEAERLKENIRSARRASCDATMEDSTTTIPTLDQVRLRIRKTLSGHIAKVYALHWGSDSKTLVSAAQDGRMMIWDAHEGLRKNRIYLPSAWVMTCAMDLTGKLVASGGLDNMCSVYGRKSRRDEYKLVQTLSGHTSYLSCCRFMNNNEVLTSSGDKTCILWDLDTGRQITCFKGHHGDINAVAISPDNEVFVSVACDTKAKVWDLRSGLCCQTLNGHTGDINAVTFFPSGKAFITGSDDKSCKLFDIRADQEIANYVKEIDSSGITSVATSRSGRLLFASNDWYNCDIWDVVKTRLVGTLHTNDARVSCIGVPPDGSSVATGSWDSLLRIWN